MNFASRPMVIAILVGTALQVAMVVAGHSNPSIKNLFAFGGMGISLLAGIIYAVMAHPPTTGSAVLGGVVAGTACAFLGIFVSYLLKDVPVTLLLLGTVSSAVTGGIGGWVGRMIGGAGTA